jgi:Electron transfer DM13
MTMNSPTPKSPRPRSRRRSFRHPLVLVGMVLVVIVAAVGAYWFQPWKLFTSKTVHEALPTVSVSQPAPGTGKQEPQILSQGELVSQEHDVTGTVQLLRLPDDSLVVRLQDLDTSDGPDLKVLLTDATVTPGLEGAYVFDDGRWVDLGSLKGTNGSANYPVPAGTDIDGLTSVSIWCDRFDVSFGAAELVEAP